MTVNLINPRKHIKDQWVGHAGQKMIPIPGRDRTGQHKVSSHSEQSVQQRVHKWKTYELFIWGIFPLMFLDCSWPQATETTESKTADKGELHYNND